MHDQQQPPPTSFDPEQFKQTQRQAWVDLLAA